MISPPLYSTLFSLKIEMISSDLTGKPFLDKQLSSWVSAFFTRVFALL
jgi:hypothetical protein